MTVFLASALLVAAALAARAHAAEQPGGDLVEVTPQRASSDPAAQGKTKDEESLIEHAVRNAHGEVGAMIASDGSRAVYGTVTMPVGENGSVTLSGATGRTRYYPYDAYGRCDYRRTPLDAPPVFIPPGATLCAAEGGPFLR
jgi:hypothetical protein